MNRSGAKQAETQVLEHALNHSASECRRVGVMSDCIDEVFATDLGRKASRCGLHPRGDSHEWFHFYKVQWSIQTNLPGGTRLLSQLKKLKIK